MDTEIITSDSKELKEILLDKVEGQKTLILGIGNKFRGDDAIGSNTAEKLKEELGNIETLDCGTNPENYLLDVKELLPDTTIFINAVKQDLENGAMVLKELPSKKEEKEFISHYISLNSISSILKQMLEEEGKNPVFLLLGVQIRDTSSKMSEKVKKRIDDLSKMFCSLEEIVEPFENKNKKILSGVL